MQDMDVLMAIAEIAGVFVGFGALISVTRGSQIGVSQLGQIRAVVTIGLVVMVAALIPVSLTRYGLSDDSLWRICSLLFLLLIWVVMIFSLRKPENRELTLNRAKSSPASAAFFWLILEIPLQVPLIIAVLGLYPELASAFYITSLVLNLCEAAFVLAQFVYSHGTTAGS